MKSGFCYQMKHFFYISLWRHIVLFMMIVLLFRLKSILLLLNSHHWTNVMKQITDMTIYYVSVSYDYLLLVIFHMERVRENIITSLPSQGRSSQSGTVIPPIFMQYLTTVYLIIQRTSRNIICFYSIFRKINNLISPEFQHYSSFSGRESNRWADISTYPPAGRINGYQAQEVVIFFGKKADFSFRSHNILMHLNNICIFVIPFSFFLFQ